VAPLNLKIGLFHNTDVLLIFDNYLYVRSKDSSGVIMTQSGVGDFTVRLKINFLGNDVGSVAFGILPYVKFPTNSDNVGNKSMEGGIILPVGVTLPRDLDVGLMTEVDLLRNVGESGHHTSLVNSVTLGHDVFRGFGGYLEFFSEVSNSPWIGTTDLGLTYLLNENIQFDFGANLGITHAADDMSLFAGITSRW
jgi:Putative MetA-pathway of phenol degradation